MNAHQTRDFSALLDDLFVARPEPEEAAARPTIPFDYLSVADELHSGRIRVADDAVKAEYEQSGASLEAELEALLDGASVVEQIVIEPLPSIEPDLIALELDLGHQTSADLGRVRRAFAMKNHPDLVAPHLRERALTRMQVANQLIDDAKQRFAAKAGAW